MIFIFQTIENGEFVDLSLSEGLAGLLLELTNIFSNDGIRSKEMVKKEVKRCLDQAKGRPGGFILMPACEYPPLAPPENLEAVREALMEYGFF